MIIKGAPAQSFRRSQAAILGFLGKVFWENTGQNAKFGAIKVVTMTFKRHLGFAKFFGVVVCSPQLGWAVVCYLRFSNPLT